MHDYLADDWAAAVAVSVPAGAYQSPRFIVDYVVDNSPAGCARWHSQTFTNGQLVDWTVGSSGQADLIVCRAYDVDRDDLLGRADAARVAATSTLGVGDVFGVGPPNRDPTWSADLAVNLGLCSPDTPFGSVERRYVMDEHGLHSGAMGDLDVVVRGPYGNLLAWLHDPGRLLGHFLVCDDFDTTVDGDYFKMSAIEGVVSAPKVTPTTDHAARLLTYAMCRGLPQVQATVDAIDSFTR